jgi:hypothetical protein
VACALLATRHAHAKELNAMGGQVTGTQVCIFEIGVAGVDDEIALLEVRQQIADHGIHGRAGGYQHHDRARSTKQSDEIPDAGHAVYFVSR